MKAYYIVPQIGTGQHNDAYRPGLPPGYSGWAVCTDAPVTTPNTWVVLVSGNAAYHAALKASPNVLWLADAEEPDATP